ncbi:MAG TPA: VWA domain-containing protein [Acidimicrobiia bacterium]|nr:VWA domain-containing protein [Acidimicrobiia bacterium]
MTDRPRIGVSGVDVSGVDLAEVAGSFGQLLHAAGVPVTPERSGRFARAVALAGAVEVDEVYWLGRVTLLTGADQIPTFDAVFGQLFRGLVDVADRRGDPNAPSPPATRRPEPRPAPTRPGEPAAAGGSGGGPALTTPGGGAAGGDAPEGLLAAASAEERLRSKDFGQLTPDELEALRGLIANLAVAAPLRTSRRRIRHHRGRLDVRATLRRAHRRGGDPVEWMRRHPKLRPRRLVLIADVSGSMEPYSRAYLHLLHGAVRGAKAEAFVFATRLTRLTRALAATQPDLALRRAAAAAPDWSGGTRIGAALADFNDRYGRRGVARGAVVVVVSDGWDTGDPAVLGEQMARLARLAHRVVWVNPRAAAPSYEPKVAGMAAALPHVDAFVSGHSVAALDALLAALL